ncbi:trace amine-associated receptor 13c-like [Hemibagrus wyckioides]|uniref:trace amine-associated receptor 13c-like n=1 Tax=Hemibagrus wyckioides TaxID=337641 RepID=UPI00266B5F0F|nr:trace amine-associated receptor 13c-like [Hemibagrus wyckioides]
MTTSRTFKDHSGSQKVPLNCQILNAMHPALYIREMLNLTEFNQSDRCEHFSCPERSVSPAVYILLYVCSAAVVLLTVCGNLLVIISVLHFKHLHTPTNTLVLSLAVTDFLIAVFVMPFVFIWSIESCWIFKTDFCISFFLTAGLLMNISIYNIALIAVDRYVALSNPFLYTNTISRRTMCIVVYSNWCVSLAYNTTLYYFTGNLRGFVLCPGECLLILDEVWSVIDLVYSFIFPLSVIIILYTQVFVIAKKHATAIRELNNHTRPKTQKITSHSMKSERKAAKVLGILVSVFLVCLLPYFIYSLLGGDIQQLETFLKMLIVLYLNSTINPVIYALFYPWFRRCIILILTLQIFQTDSALINVLS